MSITLDGNSGVITPAINFGEDDLVDYEEGTWSPTFVGSTQNPTISSYISQTGHYTRVGRIVEVYGRIGVSSGNYASGLGAVGFSLPIVNSAITRAVGVPLGNLANITDSTRPIPGFLLIGSLTGRVWLYRYGPGVSGSASSWASTSGSIDFYFGFTYQT